MDINKNKVSNLFFRGLEKFGDITAKSAQLFFSKPGLYLATGLFSISGGAYLLRERFPFIQQIVIQAAHPTYIKGVKYAAFGVGACTLLGSISYRIGSISYRVDGITYRIGQYGLQKDHQKTIENPQFWSQGIEQLRSDGLEASTLSSSDAKINAVETFKFNNEKSTPLGGIQFAGENLKSFTQKQTIALMEKIRWVERLILPQIFHIQDHFPALVNQENLRYLDISLFSHFAFVKGELLIRDPTYLPIAIYLGEFNSVILTPEKLKDLSKCHGPIQFVVSHDDPASFENTYGKMQRGLPRVVCIKKS